MSEYDYLSEVQVCIVAGPSEKAFQDSSAPLAKQARGENLWACGLWGAGVKSRRPFARLRGAYGTAGAWETFIAFGIGTIALSTSSRAVRYTGHGIHLAAPPPIPTFSVCKDGPHCVLHDGLFARAWDAAGASQDRRLPWSAVRYTGHGIHLAAPPPIPTFSVCKDGPHCVLHDGLFARAWDAAGASQDQRLPWSARQHPVCSWLQACKTRRLRSTRRPASGPAPRPTPPTPLRHWRTRETTGGRWGATARCARDRSGARARGRGLSRGRGRAANMDCPHTPPGGRRDHTHAGRAGARRACAEPATTRPRAAGRAMLQRLPRSASQHPLCSGGTGNAQRPKSPTRTQGARAHAL